MSFKKSYLIFLFLLSSIFAGDIGHYEPGVFDPRDFIMPKKGFYYLQVDPIYISPNFYNKNKKKLNSLKINESFTYKGFAIDANVDAKIKFKVQDFKIAPEFLYVTPLNIMGACFALFFSPYFGYEHVSLKTDVINDFSIDGIVLRNKKISNRETISSHNLNIGDFFINPIWVNWHLNHFEMWFRYGAYVPIGSYDSKRLANVGFGFWSHEIVWGSSIYLQECKKTALIINVNYEINQKQRHTHIVPGDYLIFEYALSHKPTKRGEFSLTGYSYMQVTDDSGNNSRNRIIKTSAHAIGPEITYFLQENNSLLSFKYLYEYLVRYKTKGQLLTINFIYDF